MKAHFVTFLSPGTLVFEETEKPIKSWDVRKAVQMSKKVTERYNAKPFGFFFTTRQRSDSELDSKQVARSKMYYLGGKLMTLQQVKAEMPDAEILISNMQCNKIKQVLVNNNSWRVVVPFEAGDTLLKA